MQAQIKLRRGQLAVFPTSLRASLANRMTLTDKEIRAINLIEVRDALEPCERCLQHAEEAYAG